MPQPTHLLIPFAGTVSEAGRHALQSLALPQLDRLLARLTPEPAAPAPGEDEFSLNPPHEQALARAWGWVDGPPAVAALPGSALPFAARQAAALGLPGARDAAWGRLTPVQLQVASDGISLTDPAALQLDAAGSRALLELVRPLFESEGFTLHWAGPLDWLASHPSFEAMPSASLDRVIGRNVAPWLPDLRAARLVRRLQNEVQMVLYTAALTEARAAAGLATVNSFWLSGCGRLPPGSTGAAGPTALAGPLVDDRLRAPALAEDWAAWCEAWRALDAGPVTELARAGTGAVLTLCGERHALTLHARPQPWWQRLRATWRRPASHSLLETL